MTSVTYDKLYSAPSENIFSIIDTRANVADPRDPQAIKNRKFVYNSEPKAKATDFGQYPYIICEDAIPGIPAGTRATKEREFFSWTHVITVRTVSKGSGNNRTDTGLTDMRNIVDDILQTFKNTTIKGTLRGYNQYDVQIGVVNVDTVDIDQLYLHETILELEYMTDIKVTV